MWSKSNILPGDDVLVENDTMWGSVVSVTEDGVFASYPDQNYQVQFEDIGSVKRNGVEVSPTTPVPAAKPSAAMTAITVDLDAQRKVAPGHIVTWSLAGRNGYDPNRLFVVLNFTKNSQQTLVNIFPLNGIQPGEGKGRTDNLGWYKVQVKNCAPVAFPAPLIKRKAGQ